MKQLLIPLVLGLLSSSVSAYTGLSQSQPADGSVHQQSPANLELKFSESVRLLRMEVSRDLSSGREAIETDFRPGASASSDFGLPLPELSVGSYKVNWTVMGADGHVVQGTLGFVINPVAVNSSELNEVERHGSSDQHAH